MSEGRYAHEVIGGRYVVRRLFRRGGSPVWKAQIRDTRTGRVIERSGGSADKRKAHQAIREWCEQQVRRDTGEAILVPLREALNEWLHGRDVEPASLRSYISHARAILRHLATGLFVAEVKPAHLDRYLEAARADGLSRTTRQKHVWMLRSFFGFALRQGWATADPTAGVKVGQEPKVHGMALTEEEASRLLCACQASQTVVQVRSRTRGSWEQRVSRSGDYLWLAVLISLYTGLRRGNVLGLEWRHVDLGAGKIELEAHEMKSRRAHSIPIHPVLLRELRPRKGAAGDRVIGREVVDPKRGFATARKAAGLDGLRWHDLRHTFATWLSSRVPFAVLQRLLGHSSGSVTFRYLHQPWSELEIAIRTLPNLTPRSDDRSVSGSDA